MQLKTYLIYYLISCLIFVIYTLLHIEKEKTRRAEKGDRRNRKRENQGEGCRRHLRQFLASLLLRLMSSPSTPSPAAHHFEGRAATPSASGRCYRHNVATPRRRSTNNQQQGSASTVCHLARLVLFPVPSFRW